MPEKASNSGFAKCNSCASSEGPGLGPLPTVSHEQVCCLFKVARPEQYAPFPNEKSHKRYDYDGICEDCPSRLKFEEELQVGPVYRPPQRSSDAPREGIVALATDCEAAPEVTGSQSRKRKKIEPRHRVGFKKPTLEWRPPKFKRKLWFGTYADDEIDRARDAVNYYLGRNEPYILPDSLGIFAGRPLKGIKFEDLLPSCDLYIEGERADKSFGRQVKDVIHSVLGRQKKSTQKKKTPQKTCKESRKLQVPLKDASRRQDICDPIVFPAPGSTTSSDTQCVSCTSLEANSNLAGSVPTFLPPARTFPQEDEEISELLKCTSQMHLDGLQSNPWVFPLDEMFVFPSAIPTSGYGEGSTTEENSYWTDLWAFPNEDPRFPSGERTHWESASYRSHGS